MIPGTGNTEFVSYFYYCLFIIIINIIYYNNNIIINMNISIIIIINIIIFFFIIDRLELSIDYISWKLNYFTPLEIHLLVLGLGSRQVAIRVTVKA